MCRSRIKFGLHKPRRPRSTTTLDTPWDTPHLDRLFGPLSPGWRRGQTLCMTSPNAWRNHLSVRATNERQGPTLSYLSASSRGRNNKVGTYRQQRDPQRPSTPSPCTRARPVSLPSDLSQQAPAPLGPCPSCIPSRPARSSAPSSPPHLLLIITHHVTLRMRPPSKIQYLRTATIRVGAFLSSTVSRASACTNSV